MNTELLEALTILEKEKNITFGAENSKYVLHFAQKAAIVKL